VNLQSRELNSGDRHRAEGKGVAAADPSAVCKRQRCFHTRAKGKEGTTERGFVAGLGNFSLDLNSVTSPFLLLIPSPRGLLLSLCGIGIENFFGEQGACVKKLVKKKKKKICFPNDSDIHTL